MKSLATTTRRGLPGRSCCHGWVQSFRWYARAVGGDIRLIVDGRQEPAFFEPEVRTRKKKRMASTTRNQVLAHLGEPLEPARGMPVDRIPAEDANRSRSAQRTKISARAGSVSPFFFDQDGRVGDVAPTWCRTRVLGCCRRARRLRMCCCPSYPLPLTPFLCATTKERMRTATVRDLRNRYLSLLR